jgi:hypothetical protein
MEEMICPPLVLSEWKETRDTLQKYCRLVGAIREVMSKPLLHSLQTNLLLNSCGFTTSSLLKNASPTIQTFEIILDVINQRLRIESNYREPLFVALTGQSLSALCDETCSLLSDIGITPPLERPSLLGGVRGRFDSVLLVNYWKSVRIINQILSNIRNEISGETSPVQLRPDDFVIILTLFDKYIENGNSSLTEQVEFGFSTGDENNPDTHLFISFYPDSELIERFVDASFLLKIKGRISCAVLPYMKLIENGNPLKIATEFFRNIYTEITTPSHKLSF